MNINFKKVALFTVLSMMAVGCQKETIVEPNTGMQQTMSIRIVTYTIDGISQRVTICGEQNWREFIDTLLALAEQGHSVSFKNETANSSQGLAKNVITFETYDKKEANEWCDHMSDEGYTVYMYFDERTGKYTCIATN